MKKNHLFFVLLLACSVSLSSNAQQTEIHASLNSGIFSYRGKSAESVSRINNNSYTNNPFGSKGGLSYGLSLNIRRAIKSNFIFGADLGYEMLRSKVNLEYTGNVGDISSEFKGKTYLNTSFINLFPYLGGRFEFAGQPLDLVGGVDIGYILSAREKGNARSIDNSQFNIKTSVDRKNMKTDIRPRVQVSADFDKIGIYLGYSHGLRNYKANLIGGSNKVYSRMWRVGATYRLK